MIYLTNYKLFERKDIELSNLAKEYYNSLYNAMKNKSYEYKRLVTDEYTTLYISFNEFPTKFTIRITSKSNGHLNAAFGLDNENPFIIMFNVSMKIMKSDNEILELFDNNKMTLIHEFTHYIDYMKSNKFKSTTNMNLWDYYNTDVERNAFFISASNWIKDKINIDLSILKDYKTFYNEFLSAPKIVNIYRCLTDKNKKKFDNRIYLLYIELKNIN